MEKKKVVRVFLKRQDFKDASYTDGENCPLCKAIKRQLKIKDIQVGSAFDSDVIDIHTEKVLYEFEGFKMWSSEICKAVQIRYANPKHDTEYYVELIPA